MVATDCGADDFGGGFTRRAAGRGLFEAASPVKETCSCVVPSSGSIPLSPLAYPSRPRRRRAVLAGFMRSSTMASASWRVETVSMTRHGTRLRHILDRRLSAIRAPWHLARCSRCRRHPHRAACTANRSALKWLLVIFRLAALSSRQLFERSRRIRESIQALKRRLDRHKNAN